MFQCVVTQEEEEEKKKTVTVCRLSEGSNQPLSFNLYNVGICISIYIYICSHTRCTNVRRVRIHIPFTFAFY